MEKLVFMTGGDFTVDTGTQKIDVFLTRSGYTGEDGFEISVHNDHAEALARALLAQPEVQAHRPGCPQLPAPGSRLVPVWQRH